MKILLGVVLATGLGVGASLHAEEHAETRVLADFSLAGGAAGWSVEDDGVMGGRSQGSFVVNEEGHGVFSGEVSLENNGGFSSVQYYFDPIDVSAFSAVFLKIKGDGKRYRFLVETEQNAWHYYEAEFDTSGDWETVEIPFSAFVPVRRGDRLDLPAFPGRTLAQIRLMIANGAAESFQIKVEKRF
jgi:NADH dehydrogenase [ubiquinone] 1 alpha subcomplex assembly factor 1